jgi:hypothetical protein
MSRLAGRLKALEEKRGVEGPLVIMRICLAGFTPEEEALFEADDERQIREAKARKRSNLTTVLLLMGDRERLTELKQQVGR